MRSKHSAGILVYRLPGKSAEVLLGHMGGPFWAKKDNGAWSIPKGEFDPEAEDVLAAAKREFTEETGQFPSFARSDLANNCSGYDPEQPDDRFIDLGTVVQSNGKTVYAFATAGDFDVAKAKSNTCKMEWPPRSGQKIEIPEIDRVEWFTLDKAKQKIVKGQIGFIDRLAKKLGIDPPADPLQQSALF